MNENRNETTKWLQYLMYVGIAALVNPILAVIPLLSGLTGWISIAISIATVFLLFKLVDSNEHYQAPAILYTVSLVISALGLIGVTALSLVGSICAIVAEYKEFKAHGELIEDRDPKLADQWGSLFWLSFALSLIAGVVSALLISVLVVGGMDEATVVIISAAVVAAVTLLMKLLYIRYLKRTIALLENEITVA